MNKPPRSARWPVVLVAVLLLVSAGPAKQYRFTCILFEHGADSVVKQGVISEARFQEWFKRGYSVGGERVETPPNATVIGVLVLTDGNEVLVMRMSTWNNGLNYACQSKEIGKAPKFRATGDSKDAFVANLKREIDRIAE